MDDLERHFRKIHCHCATHLITLKNKQKSKTHVKEKTLPFSPLCSLVSKYKSSLKVVFFFVFSI